MLLHRGIFFVVIFLLFNSCDSTEPEPPKVEPEPIVKSITLTADKFTCTEVWLSVSSENLVLPSNAGIYRGDSLVEQISLNKPDTLLYYDGLLPAKDYTFRLTIPEDTVESNAAAFRTLDTASHNFTYQTWEFGDFNSSELNDVAIINENDIWVVGEIFLKDSLGNMDPNRYNALHWDGNGWEAKRITVDFRGSQITPPLEGAFAFSSTDIWFVGSQPLHGDGTNWELYDVRATVDPNLSLSHGWGTSTNNMYFVGRGGSIAHYNGVQWQKIESGTTQIISDIWGINDNFILAAASDILGNGEKKIIEIYKLSSNDFNWTPNKRVSTLYFNDKYKIYAGGDGIWVFKNNSWERIEGLPLFYVLGMRGSAPNDIWAVGGFGYVAHFNGLTWSTFDQIKLNAGNYYGVSVSKNRVCIIGREGSRIVIKILKK